MLLKCMAVTRVVSGAPVSLKEPTKLALSSRVPSTWRLCKDLQGDI